MASSSVLLLPRLVEGANFSNWKFRIKLLLEEKGLIAAVNNDIDREEKKELEMDSKARSLIVQCISDKYIEIIKKCETAKQMISHLEKIFERKSIFNKLYLKKQLLTLKCKANESLQNHFLNFENLVTQLEAAGCTLDENDKVCHLLLTLPEDYETVVTTIETMSSGDDLTLESVKAKLLDAEIKIKGKEVPTPESSFLITCFKCGRTGHKANKCNNNQSENRSGSGNTDRGRSQFRRGRGTFRSSRGRDRGRYFGRNNYTEGDENMQRNEGFVAFSTEMEDDEEFEEKYINYIVDSGASHNFTQEKYEKYMIDVKPLKKKIQINTANGDILWATKKGTLECKYRNENITVETLIVPGISQNLLSVTRLMEKGLEIIFKNGTLKIRGKIDYYGERRGKLYIMPLKIKQKRQEEEQCNMGEKDENIWHKRLGHLNRKGLAYMKLPMSNEICDECMQNKSTRLPFQPLRKRQSRYVGDLIHSDVSGPMSTVAKDGYRYFQTIMDDYSHFTQTYLLTNKSEAADNLITYVKRMKTERNTRVNRIRCDNGGEYSSNYFKRFCYDNGIKLEYTIPYSPQMNGKAERMNRTIYDKARTILNESKLPRRLWGCAVLTATYMINRCPSFAIDFDIPARIFGQEMTLEKMRIFGSRVWAIKLPKRDKWESRAIRGRMVGYSTTGYKVWDPVTDEIIWTRDARFDETNYKYDEEEENEIKRKVNEEENVIQTEQNEEKKERKLVPEEKKEREVVSEEEKERKKVNNEEGIKTRSGRVINRPQFLNDYEQEEEYEEDVNFAYGYCYQICTDDPNKYEEAIKSDEWKEAINKELKSHETMKTWTAVDKESDMKLIDSKWIFRTKENGIKKARLVARGCQIKKETDFGENYTPVARISTVRTALVHAVNKSYSIKQFDVPTAYLNGNLEKDVYMKPPDGVELEKNKVLKLNRGLYGLRESGKCWNKRFNDFLEAKGFERSRNDFCLYMNEEKQLWLVLYVDDILLIGTEENIELVTKELKNEFKTKDLGVVNSFLGMEIERNEDILKIRQTKQIDKMLEKFNMTESNTCKTPMAKGFQVEGEVVTNVPYRQLIGGLMYIATTTRPDISYTTSFLSQYLEKPTHNLWVQAKRVLRYLKGTKTHGLVYQKHDGPDTIETYSDADWAGDKKDRKSISGSVTFYNNNIVSWFSRKQNCVALSTAEAEYVAAAVSACDLLNIKGLCKDFNLRDSAETKYVLYMDNKSAIEMTKTFENSKRAKHIDIRLHFIKDLIEKKEFKIEYVSSQNNLADIFTKSLSKEVFVKLVLNLNITT